MIHSASTLVAGDITKKPRSTAICLAPLRSPTLPPAKNNSAFIEELNHTYMIYRKVGVFYVMALWTLAHRIPEYDVRQRKFNKPNVLPQALIEWSKPSADRLKQSGQVKTLHAANPDASVEQLFAWVLIRAIEEITFNGAR